MQRILKYWLPGQESNTKIEYPLLPNGRFGRVIRTPEPSVHKKTLNDILNEFLLKFFSYLDSRTAINLLFASKLCLVYGNKLAIELQLPSEYYEDIRYQFSLPLFNAKTLAAKDYFTLQYIKELIAREEKFEKIVSMTKQLTATRILSQTGPLHSPEKHNEEWKQIISCAQQSKDEQKNKRSEVIKRLSELTKYAEGVSAEINHHILFETAIVTTCDFNLLQDPTKTTFLNYFHRVKQGYFSVSDYFYDRLAVELTHYSKAATRDLQAFVLDENIHPCYATLQSYPLQPIQHYGKDYVVVNSKFRAVATATYGAPLSFLKLNKQKEYKKPVDFSKHAFSLMAQLPDERLLYFAKAFQGEVKKEQHETPYADEKTNYIEVQLPPFTMDDLDFIYFALDGKIPPLQSIYSLRSRIPVVIGGSPFESKEFTQAFQKNQIEEFLIKKTCDLIYEAALIVGETNKKQLVINFEKDKIEFDFNITINSHQFHQAQAARILYLLGVRNFFKTTSAISLNEERIKFELPLNGTNKQLGGLDDHDAYIYDHRSLGQLLNVFIKSIITVLLVCRQNEAYWEKYKTHLSETIKGATEESNQTRELPLKDPDYLYSIEVHWSYDNLFIKVFADRNTQFFQERAQDWVKKCLQEFFGPENLTSHQNRILINLPLTAILHRIKSQWRSYKVVALIEDKERSGDLMLALRSDGEKIFGYQFSGGHNNDPLGYTDIAKDIEFGTVINDPVAFKKHLHKFGYHEPSSTEYYYFPFSGLKEVKLDETEFKSTTLKRFSLYDLGNLEDRIEVIAPHFNMSIKEYHHNFGNALPLTPYDSIFSYIRFCEKEIEKQFNNKITVHINREVKSVVYNKMNYLLPSNEFGTITIKCGELNINLILPSILECKAIHSVDLNISDNIITLKKVNPHAILFPALKSFFRYEPSNVLDDHDRLWDFFQWFESCTSMRITETQLKNILGSDMENDLKIEFFFNFSLVWQSAPTRFTKLFLEIITKKEEFDPDAIKLIKFAIKNNHLSKFIKVFQNQKIDISMRDENGNTLLHLACQRYDTCLVEFLLEQKADIYALNNDGVSTFYTAANTSNRLALSQLIAHARLNPNPVKISDDELVAQLQNEAKNDTTKKSLLQKIIWTQPQVYHLSNLYLVQTSFTLEKYKAGINLVDDSGASCLHDLLSVFYRTLKNFASQEETDKDAVIILQLLKIAISLGADPTLKDKNNSTLLHYAAMRNNVEIVKFIYELAPASLEVKSTKRAHTRYGEETPLELARNYGNFKVANFLERQLKLKHTKSQTQLVTAGFWKPTSIQELTASWIDKQSYSLVSIKKI